MGTLQHVARDLERAAPFRPLRLARAEDGTEGAENDGRTLTGYAAVFGQETEINSWEGHFFEAIRKGAFRKSIRERTPVMQFDHGRHPLIGSLPIGAITDLREDDQGLYTQARLSDNWLIQPLRDAIADESVNGMSFRFEVIRDEWRDKNGKLVKEDELLELLWMPGDRGPLKRELIELKVRELGPVVFPAYDGTSVSVRARDVARTVAHDDELTREIRSSLARDAAVPQIPEDPQLRREVATALLFPTPDQPSPAPARAAGPAEPPAPGHPATPSTTPGAPPTDGHPPQNPDAPPAPGHPSPSPRTTRLRDHIREITQVMGEQLARIESKGDD